MRVVPTARAHLADGTSTVAIRPSRPIFQRNWGIFILLATSITFVVEAQPTSGKGLRCDDTKCLGPPLDASPLYLSSCFGQEGDETGESPFVFECNVGYDVHKLIAFADGSFSYYTCCKPDQQEDNNDASTNYDTASTSTNLGTIPQCTESVCTSTNGMGGVDCWADGPVEPMGCDSSSVYKYPRKSGGRYFHQAIWWQHYACCDTAEGSSAPLSRRFYVGEAVRIALASISLTLGLILTLGILSSKTARKRSYNVYLLGVALPDLILNCFAIVLGSRSLRELNVSCPATQWTIHFYAAANTWVNGLIARQVFVLLKNSKRRKRTSSPRLRRVFIEMSGVALFAIAAGVWAVFAICRGIFDFVTNPRTAALVTSLTLFFIVGPPFLYLMYVCFRVWKDSLFPRHNSRTRTLALFFARIVICFVVFWVPAVLLFSLEKHSTSSNGSMHYAGWYLQSVQGIVSTIICLLKPDVKSAVVSFVTCQRKKTEVQDDLDPVVTRRNRWWSSLTVGSSIGGRSSSVINRLSSAFRNMSVFTGSNDFSQNIKAVQASVKAQEAVDIDNKSNDVFGQEATSTRDDNTKIGKRIKRVSFVLFGGGEGEVWTDDSHGRGFTRSEEESSWEDDEKQASEADHTTTREETMETVSDEELGEQEGVVGEPQESSGDSDKS